MTYFNGNALFFTGEEGLPELLLLEFSMPGVLTGVATGIDAAGIELGTVSGRVFGRDGVVLGTLVAVLVGVTAIDVGGTEVTPGILGGVGAA